MEEKNDKNEEQKKINISILALIITILIVIALSIFSYLNSQTDKDYNKSESGNYDNTQNDIVTDFTESLSDEQKNEMLNLLIDEVTNEDKIKVIDFSKMSKKKIEDWGEKNKVLIDFDEEYSSKIKTGKFISQSIDADEYISENDVITIIYSLGRKPTTEELNALEKAKSYSYLMHMSKKAIYDQLTSKYGENFDKKSAQYAIDHLDANWNYNALQKAKSYRENMHMSKNSIYDQLVSSYGEQFTKSEARYAINHLDD